MDFEGTFQGKSNAFFGFVKFVADGFQYNEYHFTVKIPKSDIQKYQENFQDEKIKKVVPVIQRTNYKKVDWRDKDLTNKNDLQNADMREAILPRADLRQVNLAGAILMSANLQEAKLQKANLKKAILQMANLKKANLTGADLSETNSQKACFQKANLQNANLKNADFWEANFQKADLRGANLRGAKLQNADFTSAKINKKTKFSGDGDRLDPAKFLAKNELNDAKALKNILDSLYDEFKGLEESLNYIRISIEAQLKNQFKWGGVWQRPDIKNTFYHHPMITKHKVSLREIHRDGFASNERAKRREADEILTNILEKNESQTQDMRPKK